MDVQINGNAHQLPKDATLLDVLAALKIPVDRQGIAIAVRASVVPRSEWPHHVVQPADSIEVVTAAQGG